MSHKFVFIICFLSSLVPGYAQQQESEKGLHLKYNETYKVLINDTSSGYLVNLSDTTLHLSNRLCRFGEGRINKVYNYYDVEQFTIHPSRKYTRTMLLSTGVGLFIGLLSSLGPIQLGEKNPIYVQLSPGSGAIIGTLMGALFGVFATSSKPHFNIGKQRAAFRAAYDDLTYSK